MPATQTPHPQVHIRVEKCRALPCDPFWGMLRCPLAGRGTDEAGHWGTEVPETSIGLLSRYWRSVGSSPLRLLVLLHFGEQTAGSKACEYPNLAWPNKGNSFSTDVLDPAIVLKS